MSAPRLAPSRSTVYIANLAFALTNNDIHQLVEPYGRVARVTIVKDRQTRRSRGVAFVLFVQRVEAEACARALDGRQLFGRRLRASLARDNGRAAEFVRRREYPDKSRCYECGAAGHLSYSCSHNALGSRQPPPKKSRSDRKKKKRAALEEEATRKKAAEDTEQCGDLADGDDDQHHQEEEEESLAAAIAHQHRLMTTLDSQSCRDHKPKSSSRYVQSSYFSDEEEQCQLSD